MPEPGDGTDGTDGTSGGTDGTGGEFKAQFRDELKTHDAFKDMKTINDLGDAHIALIDKMSKVPKGPESAKEYELGKPIFEGADKMNEWFRNKAFELGLPKGVAEKLHSEWNAEVKNAIAAGKAAQAEVVKKADEDLHTEWGDKYDEKAELFARFVDKFEDAGVKAMLKDAGVLDDPRMIKWGAMIAAKMQEDTLVDGKQGTGGYDEAAQSAIRPLSYPNSPEMYEKK
jgi:hypothetical protein